VLRRAEDARNYGNLHARIAVDFQALHHGKQTLEEPLAGAAK
jgi:hypothetical protein